MNDNKRDPLNDAAEGSAEEREPQDILSHSPSGAAQEAEEQIPLPSGDAVSAEDFQAAAASSPTEEAPTAVQEQQVPFIPETNGGGAPYPEDASTAAQEQQASSIPETNGGGAPYPEDASTAAQEQPPWPQTVWPQRTWPGESAQQNQPRQTAYNPYQRYAQYPSPYLQNGQPQQNNTGAYQPPYPPTQTGYSGYGQYQNSCRGPYPPNPNFRTGSYNAYQGGYPQGTPPPQPYYGQSSCYYPPQNPYYAGNSRQVQQDPRYAGNPRQVQQDPRYAGNPRQVQQDPRYAGDPRQVQQDPRYAGDPRQVQQDPRYAGNPRQVPLYPSYPPQAAQPPVPPVSNVPANIPSTEPPVPGKMSTGLKVFLWIFGIVAVLCVIGFLIVGVAESANRITQGNDSYSSDSPRADATRPPEDKSADSALPTPSGDTDPNSGGLVLEARPEGNEMDPHDIYSRVVKSTVGIETQMTDGSGLTSQGSGIIATADGYIITNAHVVGNSKTNDISVILDGDDTKYPAAVVGFDNTSDLAVLKVDKSHLSPAVFGNSDQLIVGDWVLAIGSPGGVNFASTLTGGYISALNRSLTSDASKTNMTYIQTDAAINPGNSGGPLVNMYGQVIGINSNKIMATGYEGMGFSIPINRAKTVLDDLITRGYVTGRARLGITIKELSSSEARSAGVSSGVLIVSISSDSPLSNSVAKEGDIIIEADGGKISTKRDLYSVLNSHKPGDRITMKLYQPDKRRTRDIEITLLADTGETQSPE